MKYTKEFIDSSNEGGRGFANSNLETKMLSGRDALRQGEINSTEIMCNSINVSQESTPEDYELVLAIDRLTN